MTASRGPELVGRAGELGRLAEVLEDVPAGGRVVGITGEAGVGKSALQEWLAASARSAEFRVLSAQGRQSETRLPFATLHQLLRPVLPRVDRLPPRQRDALLAGFGMSESPDTSPFFTALAVLEMLVDCTTEGPVLVCLDDVHWMDQASVDVLAFVARRIADEKIAIVGTTRDGSLPFGDEQLTLIRLSPLDDAASVSLLAARAPALSPAVAERIRRQAEGNPLALLEFAVASARATTGWPEPDEALPMTARLEHALLGRAAELDPAARTVLEVAALDDGDDLDIVLAAATILRGTPTGAADTQPAIDVGLLTVTGRRYGIAHSLVRSALRHAMTPEMRRGIHAAFATVLADRPERATWHRAAAAAGPDERIAAELEAAAEEVRRRGATSSALTWLEQAAALTPDATVRAGRLLAAAEVGYELGRYEHVERIADQVAQLPLGTRERSRLTWLEGVFHDGSTSQPAEILHLVGLARGAIADADADLALQLLIGAGRRVWWRDPGEKVRAEIVQSAHDTAVSLNDPRMLAVLALAEPIALGPLVLDRLTGRRPDGAAPPEAAAALGIAAFCVGDHLRAVEYFSTPIEAYRAQGRVGLLAEALALRAWSEINIGVFDVANSADEAVRLSEETGQAVWAATARIAMAVIQAVKAGLGEQSDLLTRAEQTALRMPNASSSLLAGAQLSRGIAALGADRPEPAYDELHRTFVPADPAYQRVQQLWTLSYLAEAAVRTGRRAEARSIVSSVEGLTGGSPTPGPLIALEYSRAVLAEPDEAQACFDVAFAGAGGSLPWHRARLQLAYGSWLRRQRRVLESRAPLRAARSTFDALGAQPWAARADHELRATGERGWRPQPNLRELLSPQEAQIAELAAKGLSNREIGEHLFLSHRTISSHLYRIFPKLGVTSRGQLSGVLADSAVDVS